eukprot:SAG25_NODE_4637_length_777_cov_1.439528_1_plen_89_part_00
MSVKIMVSSVCVRAGDESDEEDTRFGGNGLEALVMREPHGRPPLTQLTNTPRAQLTEMPGADCCGQEVHFPPAWIEGRVHRRRLRGWK